MTTITHKRLHIGSTFIGRAKLWVKERHERRAYRKSLELVPEYLRFDVGLDGGAPVATDRPGGHSFDHDPQARAVMRFM